MEYTKILKLSKPSYDDDVDVQVINKNMDILDNKIGDLPYLPLAGGTMKGDIMIPYNTGKGIKQDETHFIMFNGTNFKGVTKQTLSIKSDRFKFYCPSSREFVVDDTGVWYNGDIIPQILNNSLTDFGGNITLSNGLKLQWGKVNTVGVIGTVQHITFTSPMKNNKYCVFISKSNGDKLQPENLGGEWWSATFNFKTTGFEVACDQTATGSYVFWLAIGRGE